MRLRNLAIVFATGPVLVASWVYHLCLAAWIDGREDIRRLLTYDE